MILMVRSSGGLTLLLLVLTMSLMLSSRVGGLISVYKPAASNSSSPTTSMDPADEEMTMVAQFDDDTLSIQMEVAVIEKGIDGIDGFLMYANPPNCCTPLTMTKQLEVDALEGGGERELQWFLLAVHSPSTPDCTLRTKVENAMAAGYTGLIIHNVGSNSSSGMEEKEKREIPIFTTFIGEGEGEELKNKYSCNLGRGRPTTTGGPGDQLPNSNYNQTHHTRNVVCKYTVKLTYKVPTYTLVVGILFGVGCALVSLICIVYIFKAFFSCLHDIFMAIRSQVLSCIFRRRTLAEWTPDLPHQSCVICLDNFLPHEQLRILLCSHAFHMRCIDPWLLRGNKLCPLCKAEVVADDADLVHPSLDDDSDGDGERGGGEADDEERLLVQASSSSSTTWHNSTAPPPPPPPVVIDLSNKPSEEAELSSAHGLQYKLVDVTISESSGDHAAEEARVFPLVYVLDLNSDGVESGNTHSAAEQRQPSPPSHDTGTAQRALC